MLDHPGRRGDEMAINPRQVEAFRAVMLTGQITSAAELLGVSQPAVSRLMRDFESTIQLPLFERRGNRIRPLAAAFALLTEVERSFVGLAHIADHAAAIRSGRVGELRIAALPAMAMGVLPRFAASFMRARPEARLTVSGMPSHLVIEAVAAGQADIGYAIGPLERLDIVSERISASAVAVLPARHRLAGLRELDAGMLAGEPMIGVGAGTLFRSRIDAVFGDAYRNIVAETPLTQIACVMVCEGAGIAIVDPYSAHEYRDRGLVIRPFRPAIDLSFMQLSHDPAVGSPLARSFIDGFACYRQTVDPTGDLREPKP
jgi:DNA-binding transcriptional LysR family regulator